MSDNAETRARAKRWVADQDTNPPLELAFFSGFEEGRALLLPEIVALREQIKALEGLISGTIQHSWTSEDYDKFWLAAGKERP